MQWSNVEIPQSPLLESQITAMGPTPQIEDIVYLAQDPPFSQNQKLPVQHIHGSRNRNQVTVIQEARMTTEHLSTTDSFFMTAQEGSKMALSMYSPWDTNKRDANRGKIPIGRRAEQISGMQKTGSIAVKTMEELPSHPQELLHNAAQKFHRNREMDKCCLQLLELQHHLSCHLNHTVSLQLQHEASCLV